MMDYDIIMTCTRLCPRISVGSFPSATTVAQRSLKHWKSLGDRGNPMAFEKHRICLLLSLSVALVLLLVAGQNESSGVQVSESDKGEDCHFT